MKNIYILMVITIALLFSACGDGDGRFETGDTKIDVTVCPIIIAVDNNDLLVKNEDNTTIQVIHDANGSKQVCVLSGSAHIIRGNN